MFRAQTFDTTVCNIHEDPLSRDLPSFSFSLLYFFLFNLLLNACTVCSRKNKTIVNRKQDAKSLVAAFFGGGFYEMIYYLLLVVG